MDTSNSAWTQANSELPKDLRYKWTPATSVVPRWQLGRCLAFRQSTREWHVWMHNQELTNKGMTWNILVILPPPIVSANLRSWLVLVHQHGGPRVLLLSGYSSSVLNNGLQVETNLWPCTGLSGWPYCHIISSEDGRIVSTAGNGYLLCNFARFLPST